MSSRGGNLLTGLVPSSSKRKIYEEVIESVLEDGTREWKTRTDKVHRTDGPARVRPDGIEAWYKDNLLNRENGPARTYPDGR